MLTVVALVAVASQKAELRHAVDARLHVLVLALDEACCCHGLAAHRNRSEHRSEQKRTAASKCSACCSNELLSSPIYALGELERRLFHSG